MIQLIEKRKVNFVWLQEARGIHRNHFIILFRVFILLLVLRNFVVESLTCIHMHRKSINSIIITMKTKNKS